MIMKKLRVGTRPSKLATTQTELVIESLHSHLPGVEIESVIIRTSGDLKQDVSNPVLRDKRDWIQELETAILEDKIDLAVHSGKDVPHDISEGTIINLTSVKIGNRVLNDVQACVIQVQNAPLLFGQSALQKFGKVSIDYDRNEITFE